MDERIWTDRALAMGEGIDVPGARITRETTGAQSLISGNLDAAIAALAPRAAMLGYAETPAGPDAAIRIARDRALLVTEAPVTRAAGWQEEGFALSHAAEMYACLSLRGPGAGEVLAQALASPAPIGSASAMVHAMGLRALVTGLSDGLALWVEQAHLPFVTSFFRQAGDTR